MVIILWHLSLFWHITLVHFASRSHAVDVDPCGHIVINLNILPIILARWCSFTAMTRKLSSMCNEDRMHFPFISRDLKDFLSLPSLYTTKETLTSTWKSRSFHSLTVSYEWIIIMHEWDFATLWHLNVTFCCTKILALLGWLKAGPFHAEYANVCCKEMKQYASRKRLLIIQRCVSSIRTVNCLFTTKLRQIIWSTF